MYNVQCISTFLLLLKRLIFKTYKYFSKSIYYLDWITYRIGNIYYILRCVLIFVTRIYTCIASEAPIRMHTTAVITRYPVCTNSFVTTWFGCTRIGTCNKSIQPLFLLLQLILNGSPEDTYHKPNKFVGPFTVCLVNFLVIICMHDRPKGDLLRLSSGLSNNQSFLLFGICSPEWLYIGKVYYF